MLSYFFDVVNSFSSKRRSFLHANSVTQAEQDVLYALILIIIVTNNSSVL